MKKIKHLNFVFLVFVTETVSLSNWGWLQTHFLQSRLKLLILCLGLLNAGLAKLQYHKWTRDQTGMSLLWLPFHLTIDVIRESRPTHLSNTPDQKCYSSFSVVKGAPNLGYDVIHPQDIHKH